MASTNINKVLYDYLTDNIAMTAAYDKVYYQANMNEGKQPYADIFMIDDPKDLPSLCVSDQGQARFQCDTYVSIPIHGLNKRVIFQDSIKGLQGQIVDGFKILYIKVGNVSDRADVINGLFQYSFEAVIHWEKI